LIRRRIIGAAAAVVLAGAGFAAVTAESAGATDLVTCSGITSDAKLNPQLKSGDAKYIKASSSGVTGTCLVNEGIANDQATQDIKYKLDDQSNNQNVLTMLSNKGSLSGSVSCNRTDTSLLTDFPASYPIQGKLTQKYNQLDALSKNLSTQAYVRGGTDPLDTNPANFTLTGIIIKGVGVGGDLNATLQFFPDLLSTKNLNILDCTANPATGNAVLQDLDVSQSDGADAGTAVDPLVVSIPD
jgi:hypothetical protein